MLGLGVAAAMVVAARVWGERRRETLERERERRGRDREALRLFFLDFNDYIASLFIVLSILAS